MLTLLVMALAVSAALAAPRALSITINETPFSGKALWYKERVYVSAEDLAVSLHATYSFNPKTGEVRITLPAPTSLASPSPTSVPRPVSQGSVRHGTVARRQ